MRIVKQVGPARAAVMEARRRGSLVGFVPTMGALHAGHVSLMQAARESCGCVVVSIFVNPTQFGPGEDFQAYPRNLQTDLDICRGADVDMVFAPPVEEVYPPGAATTVHVAGLTEGLCGPHRPGHFDGVATVVTKLFNIIPADRAFFGEKDFQQLKVIERLAFDLNCGVQIVACPSVREADGLAMSSRNAYLSAAERRQAASLSAALFEARDQIAAGQRDAAALVESVRHRIENAGPCRIDYVEIVDPHTLAPVRIVAGPVRICLAVRIGRTRLIDNVGAG